MKIVFTGTTDNFEGEERNRLLKIGDFEKTNKSKISSKEFIEKYSDVEILIASPEGTQGITKELLSGLKKLKFVTLITSGYEWVDIATAKELCIPISNVKGSNAQSVAEHIWGMILSLSKRITEFDREVRNRGAYNFEEFLGKEVYGKTLGIIGLGSVGKRVARIGKAFDMKVLGSNKSGNLVDNVKLTSLDVLLSSSDIITICVPLTDETRNMISRREIENMKDGAIFVNCAREGVVVKEDVLAAVEKGKLFGYGVDTEILKPIKPDDDYLKHPNVMVNVHNGFNTIDANMNSQIMAIENIEAFLAGTPKNLIT